MRSDVTERVRAAYAPIRFTPTQDEIVARAHRPRPGWRRPRFAIAATALVVLLGLVGVVRTVNRPAPAAWAPAFAAACDRVYADQARDNPALTPQLQENPPPRDTLFAFADGDVGLRLYVFEPMLFVCVRGADGTVTGSISGNSRLNIPFLPDQVTGGLNYLASLGAPQFILGRLPRGVDAVVAVTTDGRRVPARLSGPYFAAWAPGGGLAGADADVIASQNGTPVADGPPGVLWGLADTPTLTRACRPRVQLQADQIRQRQSPPPDEPLMPPLVLILRDGDWAVAVYASRRVVIPCVLNDAGLVAAGTAASAYDGARWHEFAPVQSITSLDSTSTLHRGWVVAVVPPDTDRVDLETTGPARITEARRVGFYAATWTGPAPLELRRMTVYAGQTVYETGDGPLTTRPR
jgi:hypothetical protein